jgi:hypothetical protein
MQVSVNNPSAYAATLTGLTLTAAGGGNDQTGIDSVRVYLDEDNDGVADAGETILGSTTYNGNNGTTSIVLDLEIPAASGLNLLVLYDFDPAAPDGSYQALMNAGSLSGTSESGSIQVTGLPVAGAIITILHATFTPTSTATAIPSATPSASPTRTSSRTPTSTLSASPTWSWTPEPTDTPTPSETPTATFTENPALTETAVPTPSQTSAGGTSIVIYPNPSDGTPVHVYVPGWNGTSEVKVRIFTVAFRLVQQLVSSQSPMGKDIQIELKDNWGHPLASGLYYVVIETDLGRHVDKLIILR